MGYLAHIVLALVAQGLSEQGLATSARFAPGVALLALVPHLLGWASQRLFTRGRFRAGEFLFRCLHASPPLLYLFALTLFGWQASVSEWSGTSASFQTWPTWSLGVVFAPFVLYEVLAIDARSRLAALGDERVRWRAFQLRMFSSGLAPIATYTLVAVLVGLSDGLRVRIEEVRLWHALFACGVLAILGFSLPYLLKNTWETAPLPEGPEKEHLLAVASLASFERPNLRVWKTGGTMANAAIVGVTARSRVVLFSDSLLAQMDPRELAAVFAHEMGHAFRWHVPIFVVWVLGFFLLGDLAGEAFFPHEPLGAVLTLGAVMGVWFLVFGWLSRRFELEADLFSLELLGETRSLASALEKVGGRLRDVASWRHFSTGERLDFLESVERDRSVGRKLRRDLRRWTWVGIALFLVTATIQVARLASTLDEDRVRAEILLGDFGAAQRIVRAESEFDADLRRLVERGTELGGTPATPRELARRAREALRRDDATAARDWLELGALRGDREMADLASILHGVAGPVSWQQSVDVERGLERILNRP